MRAILRDRGLDELFRHQGYVIVPLLGQADVDRLLAFFEEFSPPKIAGFHGTMYHNDREYRVRVDRAIRDVLTPNVNRFLLDYRLCVCNFMTKEPADDSSEMPLHQDWSFVPEPEFRSVHVWCPLVDVDHQNGCLAVVPGSQHLSDPVRAFADDCPFREQFDLLRERYLRELPMKKGEAVLFDGRLVHSSPPNRSSHRRITAQAITIPAGMVIKHSWRISADRVDTYEVPDEFFFDYVLHQPPRGVEASDSIEYTPKQLTAEEVRQLDAYQSATVA